MARRSPPSQPSRSQRSLALPPRLQGNNDQIRERVIAEFAEKHGTTNAQYLLAYFKKIRGEDDGKTIEGDAEPTDD
jgi:diketogulonate reductase-like aldo/keto reductase